MVRAMSTSVIEPGTRLAGRYRLDDRVNETEGSTLWKAVDETLARAVAVRTFDEDFPRVNDVVTAARAASRVTDSRLAQVFDADDSSDHAYVVSEWVTGDSLAELLAQGPLEPERAAALIADAAEALSTAHAAGLAHQRLRPECLIWTPNGTVKITGLGVDAALRGVTSGDSSDDSEVMDARGLGSLLYAALTGHWPGHDPAPEEVGLSSAPLCDGRPCSPHQVRAGVPQLLDNVTCRALFQESRRGRPPLATPADIAEALADVPRPAPLPAPPAPAARATRTSPNPQPFPPASPYAPSYAEPVGGGSSWVTKTLLTLVILLVMAAIGVGGWQLGRTLGGQPSDNATAGGGDRARQAQVLNVSGASSFDPQGDGEEKSELAPLAVDGKPETAWETEGYNSADFGRLKPGVGLILDLGSRAQVRSVSVDLAGHAGASFAVRVTDDPGGEYRTLGTVSGAEPTAEVRSPDSARGRYVVLWFTSLPPDGGKYRAYVSEVDVRGQG